MSKPDDDGLGGGDHGEPDGESPGERGEVARLIERRRAHFMALALCSAGAVTSACGKTSNNEHSGDTTSATAATNTQTTTGAGGSVSIDPTSNSTRGAAGNTDQEGSEAGVTGSAGAGLESTSGGGSAPGPCLVPPY